jgi:hypothetical protein
MNRSFKTSFVGSSHIPKSFLRRKAIGGKINLLQSRIKVKTRKPVLKKKATPFEKCKSMVKSKVFEGVNFHKLRNSGISRKLMNKVKVKPKTYPKFFKAMITPSIIRRKKYSKNKDKDCVEGSSSLTRSFQQGSNSIGKDSFSKLGKDGKMSYLSFDKRKFTRRRRTGGPKRIQKFL